MEIGRALLEFKEKLLGLYGEKLENLILYGSYARNEETHGSDVDIAVIIDEEVSQFEEIDRIDEVADDIDLKYNILISIYPISKNRFENQKIPILKTIKEEGIMI